MTRIYKLKNDPNLNFFDPCKSVLSVVRVEFVCKALQGYFNCP
jgi:hypothetical protein